MHIRNEKVDILVNGNRIDSFDLTRRKPSVVYYLENDDFSAKLSAGKTPDAVNVDEKKRMALAYFNAAFETLADLAKLDNFQAETLREKVFEALQAESEDAFEDEGIVNFGAGLYCMIAFCSLSRRREKSLLLSAMASQSLLIAESVFLSFTGRPLFPNEAKTQDCDSGNARKGRRIYSDHAER